MKKTLIIVTVLLSTLVFSQRPGKEKIKALKTALITEKLDLTVEEAQKFWPVYNDYEKKIERLRKKDRLEVGQKLNKTGVNNLSDSESNKLIDAIIHIKEQELAYWKELVGSLRAFLPPQKILRLKKAEDNFKRMLLERLKQRGKRN